MGLGRLHKTVSLVGEFAKQCNYDQNMTYQVFLQSGLW